MPPPSAPDDDDAPPPSSDRRPAHQRPAAERPDPFAPRRPSRERVADEEDARTQAERARARQPAIAVAVVAGVLVTAAITWKSVTHPYVSRPSAPIVPAKKKAPKPAASALAADAGPGRCAPVAEPYVVGEPPKSAEPVDADAAPPEPGLTPFAIEVGRGAAFGGGFAVGVLRDQDGGSVASVATLGPEGQGGKLVKLARSRGDMNAPVVAGLGGAVLAALLEPDASGRAIKLAKVEGEHVTWGPELSEGRDESLALDLATSGPRAVVVWDDLSRDQKRSQVMLASFDPASMRAATEARPVSGTKTDAESPRLVARPGGYWLGWVARAAAPAKPKAAAPPEAAKKPAKAKAKAKHDEDDDDSEDTGYAAEPIDARWVEVVPLDESGAPTATPKAVTPKDGHVLAFDLGAMGGGDALVVFRDDDTPSGSSGGRVSSVVVRLGGAGEPWVIADEGLGSGAPALVPGWLAVADVSGGTRLANVDDKGELAGDLAVEPSLFGGEVLASGASGLFLARPLGRAVRLYVVRCGAAAVPKAP